LFSFKLTENLLFWASSINIPKSKSFTACTTYTYIIC
jgi:hypothetical protein